MERVRKYTFIAAIVVASGLSVTPALAAGQSLEDVVNSQNYSVSSGETGGAGGGNTEAPRYAAGSAEEDYANSVTDSIFKDNETRQSSNNMRDHLSKVADMSKQSKAAEAATAPLAKIVNVIVQILSYITILGLGFRVVIDSVYIVLPFIRNKLDGGAGGAAPRGPAGGGMPGMGGGFGGGGFGGGGFGGGGFGGGGFGGGGFGGARPQQQPGAGSGHQWVSNAAINAVRNEGTPDANGHSRPAYKAYFSDMIYIFILTPIMIILARSGALTTLGLTIGSLVSGMISNISGML